MVNVVNVTQFHACLSLRCCIVLLNACVYEVVNVVNVIQTQLRSNLNPHQKEYFKIIQQKGGKTGTAFNAITEYQKLMKDKDRNNGRKTGKMSLYENVCGL